MNWMKSCWQIGIQTRSRITLRKEVGKHISILENSLAQVRNN